MKKLQQYASPTLRISLALVFLWFSINQFIDPSSWEGMVPLWIPDLGISTRLVILANATFELIFGLLLLFNIYTRLAALLLALHLAGITISLGFNSIGVRDFGLTLATFSIFLERTK